MKLIDMLVEDGLNGWKWPDGVECITQDNGSSIYKGVAFGYAENPYLKKNIWLANNGTGHADVKIKKYDIVADDWATAIITREQYEAALAAKNDGWIEWGGGECPVPSGTAVDVKHRCGAVSENQQAWPKHHKESDVVVNPFSNAGQAFWRHENSVVDIIAYRLHKPQQAGQPEASEEDLNECIGQAPTAAWTGGGLPPVGCECQYRKHKKSEQSEWFNGVVKYASEFTVVIQPVCYPGETVGHPANFEFRPARSEADRKRHEAAQALCDAGGGFGKVDEKSGYGSSWFDVYDAIAAGKIPGVKLED